MTDDTRDDALDELPVDDIETAGVDDRPDCEHADVAGETLIAQTGPASEQLEGETDVLAPATESLDRPVWQRAAAVVGLLAVAGAVVAAAVTLGSQDSTLSTSTLQSWGESGDCEFVSAQQLSEATGQTVELTDASTAPSIELGTPGESYVSGCTMSFPDLGEGSDMNVVLVVGPDTVADDLSERLDAPLADVGDVTVSENGTRAAVQLAAVDGEVAVVAIQGFEDAADPVLLEQAGAAVVAAN